MRPYLTYVEYELTLEKYFDVNEAIQLLQAEINPTFLCRVAHLVTTPEAGVNHQLMKMVNLCTVMFLVLNRVNLR